ncbi:hypothetical protein BZK37_06750 [Enterococcus casseliflavus]|nr:hypothetical protein BZK37_06750 [Enterococcus casseliflavus]
MNNNTINLEYKLPNSSYARTPRTDRTADKMIVGYPDGRVFDSKVNDIKNFLHKGDTLIFNDSKTINGMVSGFNSEFGNISFHIISFSEEYVICAISIREDLKEKIVGSKFVVSENLTFSITFKDSSSHYIIQTNVSMENLIKELSLNGSPIISSYVTGDLNLSDYQNVVAQNSGSLENPVASSHLTKELLNKLKSEGINIGYLTLHCVSNSAFISEEKYTEHKVPTEWFSVPEKTASLIQKTKKNGNRVIAIGTTVTRTLESLNYNENYSIESNLTGYTSLGIFPGHEFKVIDGILTNFHGSRSSRLGLAAAFIGEQKILELYQSAIEKDYKFFEFGDCTLLFNKN